MAQDNHSSTQAPASSASKVDRAWALKDTSSARELYDEWAVEYDSDLKNEKYASPQRTVEAVINHLGEVPSTLAILDAGCGTGLVGACLQSSKLGGVMELDGNDLSAGMLDVARSKGMYRKLDVADLNQKSALPDGSYDVVVCVGTLTKGHVGPAVLFDFARLLRRNGLIAATVHGEIWQSGGFEATVEDMKSKEIVDVLQTRPFGISEEQNEGGIMLVLRKL